MDKQALADLLLKDSTPMVHKIGRGIAGAVAGVLAADAAIKTYEKIFKLAARQSHLS